MWLRDLDDALRAYDIPFDVAAGWETRGHGEMEQVAGVVCHHTAGWNDLAVVINGRSDLAGPLSHLYLRRNGRYVIVAAGRCWHNAPSTSSYHTNSRSIGIEAENDGRTPWPREQLQAYKKGCAALADWYKLSVTRIVGHKEVNTSKPDPHSINMSEFRREVQGIMEGKTVALSNEDVQRIASAVWSMKLPDRVTGEEKNARLLLDRASYNSDRLLHDLSESAKSVE